MGKKVVIFIISILIILFLIFIVREFVICNNIGLDKTNPMERDEVIELLKKGATYPNYYYSPRGEPVETLKADIYIKDNIRAYYIDSKLADWTNYNTGERMFISESGDNTIATIASGAKREENTQNGVEYSEIIDENFEYKYLGEKEYYGRKSIVIQTKGENKVKKYTIDKESGLIMKIEEFNKKYVFFTVKSTADMNLKLDVVEDKDIKRPDLTNAIVNGVKNS